MDTDTLLQGFITLAGDPGARIAFFAYVATCVLGQVGNAVWLWLGHEIEFVTDRFRQDPRSSIRSILVQLGTVIGFAAAIPFENMPLRTAIILGLLQGIATDSKLNKSARQIWTTAERTMVNNMRAATASSEGTKIDPPSTP